MKIILAGIVLADWFDYPASAVSVNGENVTDPVDIVAAASKRVFNRGNKLVTVSFTVQRTFTSLKEAETFLVAGFSTMPDEGLLEIQCGLSTDYNSVFLANAVLQGSPSNTYNGLTVKSSYSIIAPEATTSNPPQFLVGGEAMIQDDTIALSSGNTYKDITFATPFSEIPNLVANIAIPSGGEAIWANPVYPLLTTTGARIAFSGTIPGTGYYLSWSAKGAQ